MLHVNYLYMCIIITNYYKLGSCKFLRGKLTLLLLKVPESLRKIVSKFWYDNMHMH